MRLPNFSSWFLRPDRKTRVAKAYEIAWTTVAVVFVAGAIKFAQMAMQSTGLTFTRLFQWSAASAENATLVTWAAIAAGIIAYVVRQFRQKWFGIVEIGAGALTAFVILREEREVVVQCCAVIAAVFVVVRGTGNAWEGIKTEVAAEAQKRSPRTVSPIARFSVARRARRARRAARARRSRDSVGLAPRFSPASRPFAALLALCARARPGQPATVTRPPGPGGTP